MYLIKKAAESVLPAGWRKEKLSEICSFGGGSAFKEELQGQTDGDYPFIKVSDMELPDNKKYIVTSNNWINESIRKRQGIKIFPERAVVFAKVGAALMLNRRRLLTRNTAIDNNMMAAIPNSADHQYLFYLLSLIDFKEFVQKGAVPSVNQGQLSAIDIPLAPPEEQTQIAAILSTIDRAIEQTEAIIEKQTRIKTGIMQDLLTKGIDVQGNIRAEETHDIKDSPLGRIPKEWEIIKISSVTKRITSGSRWWAKYYSDEGALFIRIGNLTREHINLCLDDVIRVMPPSNSEKKRTAVKEGDVLISITADLGIIGVIPEIFGEAYINQHIALVRLDKDSINPRWVGHYLSGVASQFQLQKLNEAGAKAGLNLPTVGSLFIAKPEESEQERIVYIIDKCDCNISKKQDELEKLKRLKCGLMQDLLTGKVRVKNIIENISKYSQSIS